MINLSVYTDDNGMIILFYEDTTKKYQKTLSFYFNEFKINKYFINDFDNEKEFFKRINEFELFFTEKYRHTIIEMLFKFELLINDEASSCAKPWFYRGRLDNQTKTITYKSGIKYSKQIMKEFYKRNEGIIEELELQKNIIDFLKSL